MKSPALAAVMRTLVWMFDNRTMSVRAQRACPGDLGGKYDGEEGYYSECRGKVTTEVNRAMSDGSTQADG